jgi:hypothetical protein
VVDDVREPEVRTLVESSGDQVPVGYRIGLSGAYLHLQRLTDEGKIEQVRIGLESGHIESFAGESSAFAVTPEGVEWVAGNLRDGIDLAARPDSNDSWYRGDLQASAEDPAEPVTEMAASEAMLSWHVAGDLHVLERETQTLTVIEFDEGTTGVDADGRTVVWTSTLDDEGTGYVLLDGLTYRLGREVAEAAVAGEWLTWLPADADGSSSQQYLARIVGVEG